ncbi:26769_t:CDS:2 [Dentiscutata erythropus]|uniref:26769_t:CDS:1 n=1 Tax=Dentiscutata erythropus TaxID=1348616 RepID=A0A9N9NDT4_9GLOM|nr:26769_t:CDS:2 [Dentiscutata erythropus]
MAEIYEIVVLQKGNPKLVVNGYLMVKEKVIRNTYYWCYKKRKSECCKGRAITTFSDNLHYLKKFIKHKNHAPEASSSEVAKIRSAETLPQPQTFEEINVPASLCLTLNRELFLIKNLEINQNKILLVVQYETDLNLSENLRCLLALAFLSSEEIPTIFNILKKEIPPIACKVVLWFENTYAFGKVRKELSNSNISHN